MKPSSEIGCGDEMHKLKLNGQKNGLRVWFKKIHIYMNLHISKYVYVCMDTYLSQMELKNIIPVCLGNGPFFYLFSIITQLYTNYNNLLTLNIFKGLRAAYRSHFILLMSISLHIATHTLKALMLFF